MVEGSTPVEIVYVPTGEPPALMKTVSTIDHAFAPLPKMGLPGPRLGSLGDRRYSSVHFRGGLYYYRYPDWWGSSRFSSTPGRAMHTDLAFAPYGEQYSVSGGVGVAGASFAGNNEDTTTNLYDAQFREYGIQGRWPSPDPAGIAAANPANPQSWNRYAYVLNNPLLFIDPTGLHLVCMAGEMYDVFDYSVNGEYSGTEYDDMGPWPVGNSGGSLVFTGDGGGGGSSSGGPVLTNPDPKQLATLQTPQQDCLNQLNNTPDGKFYNFFSILSPVLGPDPRGSAIEDVGGTALKLGAFEGFTILRKGLPNNPFGSFSGFSADLIEFTAKGIVAPLIAASTVAQTIEHVGCSVVSP